MQEDRFDKRWQRPLLRLGRSDADVAAQRIVLKLEALGLIR